MNKSINQSTQVSICLPLHTNISWMQPIHNCPCNCRHKCIPDSKIQPNSSLCELYISLCLAPAICLWFLTAIWHFRMAQHLLSTELLFALHRFWHVLILFISLFPAWLKFSYKLHAIYCNFWLLCTTTSVRFFLLCVLLSIACVILINLIACITFGFAFTAVQYLLQPVLWISYFFGLLKTMVFLQIMSMNSSLQEHLEYLIFLLYPLPNCLTTDAVPPYIRGIPD